MPIGDADKLGLSLRFQFEIDNGTYNLGSWHKAEGLSVKWDVADHRAGDAGNMRWFYPGATTYSNVKLTRATTVEGTQAVKDWLQSNSFSATKQTGALYMFDAWGEGVFKWEFEGIMPVNWSGPTFAAGDSKVATETLEFTHIGFLADAKQYSFGSGGS